MKKPKDIKIIKLEPTRPDKNVSNYDFTKYEVRDAETGKYLTSVFEHEGGFINLKERTVFDTVDKAANAAVGNR